MSLSGIRQSDMMKQRRSFPSPGKITPSGDHRNISFSTPVLNQKADKRRSNMAKDIFLKKQQGFGSPSYPSPLDCIRDCKSKVNRAEQMGLVVENEASFELNQSFPKVAKSKIKPGPLDITTPTIEQFDCDGLNDVSFSPGFCKGSFSVAENPPDLSLNESWSFYNYIGGGQTGHAFPQAVRNPNKAICTINAKTSENSIFPSFVVSQLFARRPGSPGFVLSLGQDSTFGFFSLSVMQVKGAFNVKDPSTVGNRILVANEMACILFSYDQSQLIGLKLRDMIQLLESLDQLFISESHLEPSGEIIEVSGKVVDITDSDGVVIPVSLWTKKLEGTEGDTEKVPRCLCVMEPVHRTVGTVQFTKEGRIVKCDENLAMLHGFTTPDELCGLEMSKIIPKLKCPTDSNLSKEMKKQTATGRTKDGASFPLTIKIRTSQDLKKEGCEETVFHGSVFVFANISGMICFRANGLIHSINDTFSRMLFGFKKDEIIGKDIATLIPDFYEILDIVDDGIALPPVDEEYIPIPSRGQGDGAAVDIPSGLLSKTPIDKLRLHCTKTSTPNRPEETEIVVTEKQSSLKEEDYIVLDDTNGTDSSLHYVTIDDSTSQSESSSVQILSGESHPEVVEISDQSGSAQSTNVITVNASLPEFESSGNDSSLLETSEISCESSDDGIHGDVESSFVTQSDISHGQKDIKKSLADLRVTMTRKKILDKFDNSSSSSDTSGQFLDENVSCFLPLFSKRLDSQFFNSDTQIDEESSYFSRESSDVHSSRSSSGHSSDETQPSLEHVPNLNMHETTSGTQTNVLDKLVTDRPELLSFTGQAQHADGSWLGVIFQIKKVELGDGSSMFCMWLSRDPHEPGEGGRSCASLTLASSFNSTIDQSSANLSLGTALTDSKIEKAEKSPKKSVEASYDPDQGPYSQHYQTLTSIGKGAFGFVKLGRRYSDNIEVVVKFIQKKKVNKESWLEDKQHGRTPLEVNLLRKLDHPNIVKVVDVFENDLFIQMVMEKHGLGMDLFEFIDRCPRMDEALASYIFRQMVSGISYLHSKHILHRDVKDENIILDERFHIKLIDFGAAAYMAPGKLFGTFCGTLEYCSPEVISGNKYRGPELEIWSMGVTLYTLVFGENPFFDVDETIAGILNPPCQQSNALMFLISWTLHTDPRCRATISDLEENAWVNQEIDIENYVWEEVMPNCEFTGNTACDNRDDLPDGSPATKADDTSTEDEDNLSKIMQKSLVLDDSSTEYF